MIKKSKYCTNIMKKKRKKETNFENSINYWIGDNDYADSDVKVTDHCHNTAEIIISVINVKLNHKTAVVFYNLKNYDSHLIMHELGKFNLKKNIILNELEKYISISKSIFTS